MATSQQLTADFLTCHICMEVYQHPCTLHCGHTYCKGCLTKYIQTQTDAIKAGSIPCPSCRRHIPVPHPDRPADCWAGQFKPGLVIQGLMDSLIHGNADTDNCSVCKEEGKTTPAIHRCSGCEASLCGFCLRYHNKMCTLHHHASSQLSRRTSPVQVKKKMLVCKEHEKKIKIFCKDCRKAVCTVCCSVDHRDCKDVVTIQAMLPEVKQDLAQQQKKQMNDADTTSRHVTEIKKEVEEFVAKSAKVNTELGETINDAVHCLRQKEKTLLDKVDDITDRQTEELQARIKSHEIMIQMYQQQSHFIQQALKFEDEAQLYEMYLSPGSGTVGDNTETHSEDRSDVSEISFTHNMEKLREDIDMMDVRTVCDEVIDLTATPVLHKVVDVKMEDDRSDPDLRDVAILNVNGIETLVVTDLGNSSIKSIYVKNGKTFHSKVKTHYLPLSLTVLNEYKVAVSIPYLMKIQLFAVNPDLVLHSTIKTNKRYFSLAVLDQSTLVAGSSSPPSVDVLDIRGNVLKSFTTLTSIQQSIEDPHYLHVTNKGNILVSDCGLKSVICLTPTGEVVFHYTPAGDKQLKGPCGITSTSRGDILLADYYTDKVIHLTKSGQYVQDVLSSKDGLESPRSLAVDGDKVYVATKCSGVHVFKFPRSGSYSFLKIILTVLGLMFLYSFY